MKQVIRIIPRLDIKGSSLIKGVHLEGLRVLGKPEYFAKLYYEAGADELIYMDAVASLYDRNSLHDIISKTAREIFIPFTVGGGVRTLDDIRDILRAGADKVAINTAAINNPEFVKKASIRFGSSTIVISIEAIKHPDGTYFAYTQNGREFTGVEVLSWAKQVQELGVGEILLTSVDKEGTGKGFDTELVRMVSQEVSIPVIASGGAGKIKDILDIIKIGKADAVAIGSMFHYSVVQNNRSSLPGDIEGNIDFLKSGSIFSKIQTTTIQEVKKQLRKSLIQVRP